MNPERNRKTKAASIGLRVWFKTPRENPPLKSVLRHLPRSVTPFAGWPLPASDRDAASCQHPGRTEDGDRNFIVASYSTFGLENRSCLQAESCMRFLDCGGVYI